MKEIFKSRCAFSMALLASATLMEGAKCVPASMMDAYNAFTSLATSGVEPEVTFLNAGECIYFIAGINSFR
jgi:hypothetical protein